MGTITHRHRTTHAAARRQRAELRAMTPSMRLAIAAALSDDVRALAVAGIRARSAARSEARSEARVSEELARIVLGRRLAAAVARAHAASAR